MLSFNNILFKKTKTYKQVGNCLLCIYLIIYLTDCCQYSQWNIVLHKMVNCKPDEGDLRSSIQCFRICHPGKFTIPQKGHKLPRLVKGIRGFSYEERLKTPKRQPLEKRSLRNDLVLTNKILSNQIDLEATIYFKFSRRPGLRRSSIVKGE